MTNVARIGVKIFRNKRDGKALPMVGYRSEIHDLDTGKLLPVESVDIHIDCHNYVTATVELEISDIEIAETD